MSHIESGFCITDLNVLNNVIKNTCPELELVKSPTYRTWVTDYGRLAGDYPLPAMYQLILLNELRKKGVNIRELCAKAGYELPENWVEMEKKPWSLEQQNKLKQTSPEFVEEYKRIEQQVISKDSEYCIRYKPETNKCGYEIGLVKHPIRNEYVMMADWYNDGYGLFKAQGLGGVNQSNGKTEWGNTLKQNYAVTLVEEKVQQEIAQGNPAYGSYTKTTLADGRIKLEVQSR